MSPLQTSSFTSSSRFDLCDKKSVNNLTSQMASFKMTSAMPSRVPTRIGNSNIYLNNIKQLY